MSGATFRASVGAVVVNRDGLVLACERADVPGAWQLPQGGLDEGEEPGDAVRRELFEETGIGAGQLVELGAHPGWLAYELPPELRRPDLGRGQVQKWFLFAFTGDDRDIDLAAAESGEFAAWRWMRLAELAEQAAEFRRGVYRALAAEFARHLA